MRYIDSWQLGCYVINYIIDKINPTPVSNPRSTGQTDFISPNRPRLVSQAEDAPPPHTLQLPVHEQRRSGRQPAGALLGGAAHCDARTARPMQAASDCLAGTQGPYAETANSSLVSAGTLS